MTLLCGVYGRVIPPMRSGIDGERQQQWKRQAGAMNEERRSGKKWPKIWAPGHSPTLGCKTQVPECQVFEHQVACVRFGKGFWTVFGFI